MYSSAYFALKAVTDTNYETARTLPYELVDARWRLFTTTYVVGGPGIAAHTAASDQLTLPNLGATTMVQASPL